MSEPAMDSTLSQILNELYRLAAENSQLKQLLQSLQEKSPE